MKEKDDSSKSDTKTKNLPPVINARPVRKSEIKEETPKNDSKDETSPSESNKNEIISFSSDMQNETAQTETQQVATDPLPPPPPPQPHFPYLRGETFMPFENFNNNNNKVDPSQFRASREAQTYKTPPTTSYLPVECYPLFDLDPAFQRKNDYEVACLLLQQIIQHFYNVGATEATRATIWNSIKTAVESLSLHQTKAHHVAAANLLKNSMKVLLRGPSLPWFMLDPAIVNFQIKCSKKLLGISSDVTNNNSHGHNHSTKVYVVGSTPVLGKWSINASIKMKKKIHKNESSEDTNYEYYVATVKLPFGLHEYKYCIVSQHNSSTTVQWEEGVSRVISISNEDTRHLKDAWRDENYDKASDNKYLTLLKDEPVKNETLVMYGLTLVEKNRINKLLEWWKEIRRENEKFYPIRPSDDQEMTECQDFNSIANLPNTILFDIFSLLIEDPRDFFNFSFTCKSIYRIVNAGENSNYLEEMLYKRMYKHHFGKPTKLQSDSWHEHFISKSVEMKNKFSHYGIGVCISCRQPFWFDTNLKDPSYRNRYTTRNNPWREKRKELTSNEYGLLNPEEFSSTSFILRDQERRFRTDMYYEVNNFIYEYDHQHKGYRVPSNQLYKVIEAIVNYFQ